MARVSWSLVTLSVLVGCASDPGVMAVDASAGAEASVAWREETPVDGRFTRPEWVVLSRMSPIPAQLPSPTNRVANQPRAVALGDALFHDTGLSRDGTVACASCHVPEQHLMDARPIAVAQLTRTLGTRNTPSLAWVTDHRWQGWAGVTDTVWAQSIAALENPREHALSRRALAEYVLARHRAGYELVFGEAPALSSSDAIHQVAANTGKVIEAFVRTLRPRRPAPFDRYVAGERDAMSPAARDGLALFLRVGCMHCHHGPLFSDFDFHNIRMPDHPSVGADRGRAEAVPALVANPYVSWGDFSDSPAGIARPEPVTRESEGQFVTPSLRGVAETAPYGHAGTIATLEDVIHHDAIGGLPAGDARAVGPVDRLLVPFVPTDAEVAALVAFLRALSSPE